MLKRSLFTVVIVAVAAAPSFAQRKDRPAPKALAATQYNPAFRALFKPAVEKAMRSSVRIQVDGTDAALGAVVSEAGYIVTKASELKSGKLSIKTHDGRDLDARLAATSEAFDLALLKADGTGLTPIAWSSSSEALVGNWLAIPTASGDPAAVGVVSTTPRSPPPPYGPPRVPTEKSGFLGVQLDPDAAGATIFSVTPDSAAAKAGIQAKDVIVRIDSHEIANQETMINTLLGYKAGEVVTIVLEREGKRMELKATLGPRPADLLPKKGKGGGNRGDFQNSMGSTLSDRRTGFPRFFQTDAVVKPADCGGPVVDLDGRVVGLMICRAGRTESHVIPGETVKELVPLLLAAKQEGNPLDRVNAVREAVKKAEAAKAAPEVIAEGKRLLSSAEGEAKWWQDRPIEKGPVPRLIGGESEKTPMPRTVAK
jgi:serine protease Do